MAVMTISFSSLKILAYFTHFSMLHAQQGPSAVTLFGCTASHLSLSPFVTFYAEW